MPSESYHCVLLNIKSMIAGSMVSVVWAMSMLIASSAWASNRDVPAIANPPESFFGMVDRRDRQVAREFYKKHISVDGLSIVASEEVSDFALQRAHEIVAHMLAGREDVLNRMIQDEMYLIIIGKDQVYTDMPEHRHVRDKAYMNERVRGTGGKPTSFGEENLLSLALDRYDDESIAVHEFCHTIDGALRSLDENWESRLKTVYQNAIASGKYRNMYAATNAGEYWAEIAQAYFDCNRVNNWNHGPVGTREELRDYDPDGYHLVHSTFQLSADKDWRYRYVNKHPIVIAPPGRFEIDPYYTKFSWAREFIVVGRSATDEQLLQANRTIRHMFAYRHDVLKTLIGRNVRLIVLGEHEVISDLPDWPKLKAAGTDPGSRFVPFHASTNVMVIDGNALTQAPALRNAVGNPVIHAMTDAFYQLTADRPEDANWENRGYNVQQYELNVERLDERFGNRVRKLWSDARSQGLWSGTPASSNERDYLSAGVLAYFDAGGTLLKPADYHGAVIDRATLKQYDPELYSLVHQLMAYENRVDWRFGID